MNIRIEIKSDYSIGHFNAMACPCEILVDSTDPRLIERLTQSAYIEAKRIEKKFSRYSKDNIIHSINTSNGNKIKLDDETSLMIDFADQCFELSEEKFDITSGILRKIWKFDGSDRIPNKEQVEKIRPLIGWKKVKWEKPFIIMPENMEIDLGGIGKEYAVDSTAKILSSHTDTSFLVNFGGDIMCPIPRNNNTPWMIGLDDPDNTGKNSIGKIALYQGGLATSGDTQRFLLKNGVRYSHILNPKTAYPVPDAPRSVTVIANTCTEAGMLSTFAMLEGDKAIEFLKAQNVKYWCS